MCDGAVTGRRLNASFRNRVVYQIWPPRSVRGVALKRGDPLLAHVRPLTLQKVRLAMGRGSVASLERVLLGCSVSGKMKGGCN